MALRRLTLLLVVAFGLVPCWRDQRAGDTSVRPTNPRVVGDVAIRTAAVAPPSTRPYSIAPFAPWRYRLKSVLQESDYRVHLESDLAPLPLPGRSYSAAVPTSKSGPSCTVVPLRC